MRIKAALGTKYPMSLRINLLNKYFRTSRKILYINIKKKILQEYIDIFGMK